MQLFLHLHPLHQFHHDDDGRDRVHRDDDHDASSAARQTNRLLSHRLHRIRHQCRQPTRQRLLLRHQRNRRPDQQAFSEPAQEPSSWTPCRPIPTHPVPANTYHHRRRQEQKPGPPAFALDALREFRVQERLLHEPADAHPVDVGCCLHDRYAVQAAQLLVFLGVRELPFAHRLPARQHYEQDGRNRDPDGAIPRAFPEQSQAYDALEARQLQPRSRLPLLRPLPRHRRRHRSRRPLLRRLLHPHPRRHRHRLRHRSRSSRRFPLLLRLACSQLGLHRRLRLKTRSGRPGLHRSRELTSMPRRADPEPSVCARRQQRPQASPD